MDSNAVIGILVLIGLVALTIGIVRSRKRRRQAIQAWAASHGWSYAKSDDLILRQWTSLPIRQGITSHVLRRSTAQGEVFSLENYYGSSGHSGTTQQLVGIDLDTVVPTAQIVPAQWLQRAFKRYTRVPISDPDFNRDWAILTSSEAEADQIQKLITPEFTSRLLRDGANLVRTEIVLERKHLVMVLPGAQQVDRIEEMTQFVSNLARAIHNADR